MFKTKALGIGTLITIILVFILEIIFGPWGGYLGLFLGGLVGIYFMEADYQEAVIHGAVIGILTGVVFDVILIIVALLNGVPLGLYLVGGGMLTLFLSLIAYAILVSLGSVAAVYLKTNLLK